MLDGFKKFIARGNMVDMAVGVVMGAAVTGIVNALVDSIINPLIAAIFGKPDLSKTWNWTITNWAGENSVISFGSLLNALLNFLIIAIAVYFCIVVPINKLRDMSEKAMAKLKKGGDEDVAASQPDLSPEEQTVILLQDIRNSLADQQAAAAAPETSAAPTATVTVESK
ncbi:large conductance mechanosensitive channel protein MscL [Bifidobacterium pseudolongum]|uniref:large conductance mechanosensitive channel protein MscL n=1 Tax=Bifidobacterium pseudolongum TaxID=1694 RepID=UPI00050288F4|nr:large conductance mechanosensitive channel protein MscL [Bifidobacterium pseudolongum]KFI77889.1 large-conductance mechanosensitive channel [Bifidobacterium pseudolongum subsp. pseudolongum]UNP91330.1 large conductance mechanosensitive channel protein MscL [Bifidobacterium pseudolongum subsp. pseudolongum]WCA40945.1 large conductance mechanosensitive channel protein MscL [Bifidobacterium pseudolongum subsp. pseudolongum]